jgi:hypothetical protein
MSAALHTTPRGEAPDFRETRARQADRQRKAVVTFMERHRLTAAEWARRAELPSANALYTYLSGGTHFLSPPTLSALARAVPGATVSQIIGEAPIETRPPLRVLPVRAIAGLGRWRESYDLPVPLDLELPIPASVQADEMVRLGDEHASEIYPAGSYLAVGGVAALPYPLRAGDRVLLHRIARRRHELTVREIVERADGSAELVLRGADGPAIPLPWPYDGRTWELKGDRLQVRGRVVMSLLLEAGEA